MTVVGLDDFEASQDESFADASTLEDDINRAQRLARLLDSQFEMFGVRFGVDAILGLVPAIGDTIGFLAGLYPIHVVRKHGLGKALERRMIANLLVDYVIGIVPILGDVFDVAFKANQKNVRLLRDAATSSNRQSRRRRRRHVVANAVA